MNHYPLFTVACLGCILSIAFAPPLSAQEPDFSIVANPQNAELGSNVALAGDINGDGSPDIAVADRSIKVGEFFSSGVVYIFSGTDGAVLRTYSGTPANGQLFGSALTTLDADGDGVTDLAVGATGRAWSAGGVTIYSGADGSVIADAVGSGLGLMGSSLANAGDQNGDGFDDLYVGAPLANAYRGVVYTLSGRDASLISSVTTDAASSSFGAHVLAVDDVDGDGARDLAVASPYYRIGFYSHGRVQLIRSSDNQVSAELVGEAPYTYLGYSLAPAADISGDGVGDVMVGSFSGGVALVLSGADLSTLRDLTIPAFPAFRPLNVAGSLDYDSDGIEDWLLGSYGLVNQDGTLLAGVRLVSGADGSALFEKVAASTAFTGLGQVQAVLPGVGFGVGAPRLLNPTTGGYGSASIWKLSQDSDGDGVPDSEDLNPFSQVDPTVSILGLDTNVTNTVDSNGLTIADRFVALGELDDYGNESHYFVAVRQLASDLAKDALLDQQEVKAIAAAALQVSVHTKKRGR